jgi:hypothetical protein
VKSRLQLLILQELNFYIYATTAITLLDTASSRWLGDLKAATLDQLHDMLLTVREPNSTTLTFLLFLWARALVPGGKVIEMYRERRRGPRYLFLADTEVTNMISDVP